MSYSQLMASPRGPCDNITAFTAFVMRALGIPVTVDYVPRWIMVASGHTWNTVCDSAGQHISFMGAGSNPGEPHQGNTMLKAKAYRRIFSNSYAIPGKPENIPSLLQGNMVDISIEHKNMANLRIPLKHKTDTLVNCVYLAQIDGTGWIPTVYGHVKNDSVYFGATGKNIIYLPVYYINNRTIPAGDPLWLDDEGVPLIIDSHSPDSTFVINSIKQDSVIYAFRMQNGVFEGANKSDFSDAKTLFTITTIPKRRFNTKIINDTVSYRYVRYLTPPYGNCNVAEIEFYNTNGERLTGEHIGTEGAYETGIMTGDKVFDGDTCTFFDSKDIDRHTAWTGLDLQTAKRIGTIRYYPRLNKGFSIYKGHTYEAFYYTKNGWTSLGKQTVESNTLNLTVPRYALMYIDNITTQMHGIEFFVSQKDNKRHWRDEKIDIY
jgi:hypothetical protein